MGESLVAEKAVVSAAESAEGRDVHWGVGLVVAKDAASARSWATTWASSTETARALSWALGWGEAKGEKSVETSAAAKVFC